MKQKSQRALPVILLAIFLDLVTNGILVPIVPQLLGDPTSPYYLLPASVPVSYAYIILGLLIACYPFFMFFATPVLGEYSDYVGRRRVMTIALLGSGIALVIFAVGVYLRNLPLLFFARIVGGILGGNLSVAQAAMADITPPEKRANRFGLIGAAYGVGFIIGPVLGGVMSDSSILPWFGISTPFWFAAGLSVFNAILVYIFLDETRPRRQPISLAWGKSISHIFHAYGMKNLRAIFATNFLFQGGLALFATFFAVFLASEYEFNQTAVGYYIGYAGLWVIISQGFLLRMLTKKFDEIALLRFFLLAGAGSVFLYYISERLTSLLLVGALFALTNGIVMAALPSLASRRTSDENQGEILGINSSVQALAQVFPPVIAGLLAAQITPAAPVYVAGAVIGLAWVFFMATVRR